MAGHENRFKGIKIGSYSVEDGKKLAQDLLKYINGDITVVCIGTDRSTGDSFAPFVGTILKERGFKNVIGTLDDPVHAMNLGERIKEIPPNTTVLAIDASVGKKENIGKLLLNSGALYAGRGVGKDLPPIGDFNIKGIVNIDSNCVEMNYMALGVTRLSTVVKLAKQCADSIEEAFSVEGKTLQRLSAVK